MMTLEYFRYFGMIGRATMCEETTNNQIFSAGRRAERKLPTPRRHVETDRLPGRFPTCGGDLSQPLLKRQLV